MADVTIPAGAVTCRAGDPVGYAVASVTIAAGKVVYLNSSGQAALADADDVSQAVAVGVAVSSATANERLTYAKSGSRITVASAAFTKGTPYFVSATGGGIAPHADLASGDYVTYLGTAASTTTFDINIHNSGTTV